MLFCSFDGRANFDFVVFWQENRPHFASIVMILTINFVIVQKFVQDDFFTIVVIVNYENVVIVTNSDLGNCVVTSIKPARSVLWLIACLHKRDGMLFIHILVDNCKLVICNIILLLLFIVHVYHSVGVSISI